jgi:hypothetical protein
MEAAGVKHSTRSGCYEKSGQEARSGFADCDSREESGRHLTERSGMIAQKFQSQPMDRRSGVAEAGSR